MAIEFYETPEGMVTCNPVEAAKMWSAEARVIRSENAELRRGRDEAVVNRKTIETMYHAMFVDMLAVLDDEGWNPDPDEWSLEDVPRLAREMRDELARSRGLAAKLRARAEAAEAEVAKLREMLGACFKRFEDPAHDVIGEWLHVEFGTTK